MVAKIGKTDQFITPEALLDGLDWAITEGADVILMAADFPRLDPNMLERLQDKTNEARAKNIICVAPAGNSSERNPQKRYPASLDGVLSVGAADKFGQKCYFSAKSYDLDLIAPGEMLDVVGVDGNTILQNAHHTAIAAAFAAGCLALMVSVAKKTRASLHTRSTIGTI